MKVVRIIARLNVGGPARHVTWLTAALSAAGVESVLVAGRVPPGEGDMTYFAEAHGIKPLIIPEMSREISLGDAITIWKLYRHLVRLKPDIVHTHTAKAGTAGRIAGMLYRWLVPSALIGRPRPVRFVHTYHGHIFHSYYGALKTRVFLLIEKVLARVATDAIVVISPQQYREIHETFGVGRSPQFVCIPLGLDLEAFHDWPTRRRVLREELGAGDDEILVGIVGRLTEIKNHSLFLRTAAHYKKELEGAGAGGRAPRVRFLVIGDGQLSDVLKEEARSLGLETDLLFLGQRDDPENFYPGLDIVALTSRNEGTPLTLIEAMANERAVAARAVGGVVDLLGDETAALLAQDKEYALHERGVMVRASADAAGFADALSALVDNERLRREMGERGRRFVESSYAKERLVADIMKLYQELLHTERASLKSDLSQAARLQRAIKGTSLKEE